MSCRDECRVHVPVTPAPPEPPVGTWVKDRFGAVHYRKSDGWSAAPTGFESFGIWECMWEARGPLVECGPWGAELMDAQACPTCGRKTVWDSTHDPHAWRHVDIDSRWCNMDDTRTAHLVMPPDVTDRFRQAEPWSDQANPELWR